VGQPRIPGGEFDEKRLDVGQFEIGGIVVPPAVELGLLLGPVLGRRIELGPRQDGQMPGALDFELVDETLSHPPRNEQGGGQNQYDRQAEEHPALGRQRQTENEHPWGGHRRSL